MQESPKTLLETYSPSNRRRASTLFRVDPQLLIDAVDQEGQQNSLMITSPGLRSTNRQGVLSNLQETQRIIRSQFAAIGGIIAEVDTHMRNRMDRHESQLFVVMRKEIEQMKSSTEDLVRKLNKVIDEKNKEHEIFALNNELDYFKAQCFRLFAENKQLSEKNEQLKQQVINAQIEVQTHRSTMEKLKRKTMAFQSVRDYLPLSDLKDGQVRNFKSISQMSLQNNRNMARPSRYASEQRHKTDVQQAHTNENTLSPNPLFKSQFDGLGRSEKRWKLNGNHCSVRKEKKRYRMDNLRDSSQLFQRLQNIKSIKIEVTLPKTQSKDPTVFENHKQDEFDAVRNGGNQNQIQESIPFLSTTYRSPNQKAVLNRSNRNQSSMK